MTQRLTGRTALVTGSSRGIGRAIAQRLAAEGAAVVVTARSTTSSRSVRDGHEHVLEGTLGETVQLIERAGGKAVAVAADLEDPVQRAGLIDAAVDAVGGIDILVNNAGFADYSTIEAMEEGTFDRTLEHYLKVPYLLSQAVIPRMRKAGGGWIVNIGSSTGLPPIRPFRDYNKTSGDVIYASAKAALHRFTQGLAAEVLDDNIAVNVVGPSTAIMTPGAATLLPDGYETEPVEYLAQTVLEMCSLPATERTGLVAFSLHFPWSQGITVKSLDGTSELPELQPPAWANPNIAPDGLKA
ncbi:SDR family NAD(P)-dependent oxidoreductase [Rhodococcus phenolicus]|uniref:SDR family NAD(P)-dependent oxidoreductase n=1 Tax=Rhodococcus phenolicus TaxID=263849 RepID=UPI00082BD5DA|nr:SDR family NAD(P)-dependent oxidoreductase [Rhodococcus phenolicus]